MRQAYELWATKRLRLRPVCAMEQTITCIPLRGDPVCMACYEAERDEQIKREERQEGRNAA